MDTNSLCHVLRLIFSAASFAFRVSGPYVYTASSVLFCPTQHGLDGDISQAFSAGFCYKEESPKREYAAMQEVARQDSDFCLFFLLFFTSFVTLSSLFVCLRLIIPPPDRFTNS